MAQSFEAWFASLGIITKACMALLIGSTLAVTLGVLNPYLLLLNDSAIKSLQLWRFVTSAFFLGGVSFQWLMTVFSFITFLKFNEESDFKDKPADFAWAIAFIVLVLGVVGLYLNLPVTSSAMYIAICWMYCKRNPDAKLGLFGFEFRAPLFPWILIAVNVFLGGSDPITNFIGVVAGHLYVFLHDVLPQTYGVDPLRTPLFLQRFFVPYGQNVRGSVNAFGRGNPARPGAAAAAAPKSNYFYGTGKRLGTS